MRPWAARPRRRSLTELIGVSAVPNVFRSAAVLTELSVFHSADARPVAAGGMFLSESRRSLLASVDLKKLTWTFPLMHRRLSHAFFKELQVLSKCLGVVWLGFFFALLYGWESYIWYLLHDLRVFAGPVGLVVPSSEWHKHRTLFTKFACVCVCESESRQGVVSQPPSNHSLHKQELELKGYAINAINKQSGKVSWLLLARSCTKGSIFIP